jgi:hypothetical protein
VEGLLSTMKAFILLCWLLLALVYFGTVIALISLGLNELVAKLLTP